MAGSLAMQPFGVGADCVWEIGGNQFARYFCTGSAIFSANLLCRPSESVHIAIMPERDPNEEAFEQVEKATESEPVKGEDLLESQDLKRITDDNTSRPRS